MNHVMIDLETLDTGSNSVILTISAVQFDLNTGKLGKEFEIGVYIDQQKDNGGTISENTQKWWDLPDQAEARKVLASIMTHPVDTVLKEFNIWLVGLNQSLNDIKLWGNGATFDNVILRNLYFREKVPFILPFWCDNDVRTLVTLANGDTREYKFTGTKHKGIDDCKHQINYCVDMLNKMKEGK